MFRRILALALFALPLLAWAAGPTGASSAPTPIPVAQDAQDIAARLNALAPLLRAPPPVVPAALMPKDGDACAVELATVALLYRNDPDTWRNRFFGLLAIDDYQARARKEYNLIGGEDVAQVVNDALAVVPGVTDERMRFVVGFCEMKRTQPFVMTRKAGMIAMSRVMRGMMLVDLLIGTDEDGRAMANAIDAHTASLHPGLEAPWEKPLE